MEFEKNTNYESDTSSGNDVEKRKKKSRKKKVVAPVPIDEGTRQTIQNEAAPAPTPKKKEKGPKSSKKAEKVRVPKSTSKEAVKKPEAKPEVTPEAPSETVAEQSSAGESLGSDASKDKPGSTERRDDAVEGPETVVSLSETSDDEGMIFVSDRLRKQQSPEESEIRVSPEHEIEDDGEATGVSTKTPASKKRTQKKPVQSTTSGGGSGTKTRQTDSASTRGASNTGQRAKETVPPAAATNASTYSSERAQSSAQAPEAPESVSGGGGFIPPERSRASAASEDQERSSVRSRIFNTLTPERAERGNVRRERYGFVQGVLLGAIVEHIRHKRREKRMTKEHTKETKAAKKEYTTKVEKLEHATKREKTTLEKQLERLRGEATTAQKEVADLKRAQSKTAEQNPERPQILTAAPAEKVRHPVAATQESSAQRAEKQAELAKKTVAEAQPMDEVEEALKLPANHKLESSAWHNIEVDKKTGKAVENPALAYGEEFKHEQHQEQLRKQIADMSMESDRVRENYLFKSMPSQQQATKQKSPSPSPGTPPPAPKAQKPTNATKIAAQKAQQRIARAEPVDIVLWIALFFVIIIIIALL